MRSFPLLFYSHILTVIPEGSEGKESEDIDLTPSRPSPPPVPPSATHSKRVHSKAAATSKLERPGRYKERVLASSEDNSSEEDVDMDMEDNDDSGSSLDSDHVPAKRLRTSIGTRSSRVTPTSEGPAEVNVRQDIPPTTNADSPTLSASDVRPEPEPGVPGIGPNTNIPPSGAHIDPDTTSRRSPSADMHVDDADPGIGADISDPVGVGDRCVRKQADRPSQPSSPEPITPSQPLEPEAGSDSELEIPGFLSGKFDIYEYLTGVKDTGFKELLKHYIAFELADHSRVRGCFTTADRPNAISWWIGRSRIGTIPPFDSLKSFTKSIIQWWTTIQPDWRKIKVGRISHTEEDLEDWERLYQPGVNGLLNVVILAYWWARILEERGSAIDSTYSWFVSDVTWVLSRLTVVAREGVF